MGDLNHLEKMGRELKCPICLSLLRSAASLGCNHVFCSVCIEKSMKSDSNCPVCKVPYRRREVRPAPHMDNLVSIYKSMEAASGMNIFVTQIPSSAKLSEDVDKQVQGNGTCSKRFNADISEIHTDEQRTTKKKLRKMETSNQKNSAPLPAKPSFPRKKRVQVPQCNLSTAHTPITSSVSQFNQMDDEAPRKNTVVLGDNGEPVLSPFFWLRGDEEDEQKSSQHSDWDQPTDSMLNVPCFSDIKDSMEEESGKPSNDFDVFDSEMFEWTQRACSPELCSSPLKLQVEDVARNEMASIAAPNEALGGENSNENNNQTGGIPNIRRPDVLSLEGKETKGLKGSMKPNKRGRKKQIALKKCVSINRELVIGHDSHLAEKTASLSQKQEKGNKKSKKAHFSVEAIKEALDNTHAVPIILETPYVSLENFDTDTSTYPPAEKINPFPEQSFKNGRAQRGGSGRRSKKQKLDLTDNKSSEEPAFNRNQRDDFASPYLTTSTPAIVASTDKEIGYEKQVTNSSDRITVNEYDNSMQEKCANTQAKHIQLTEKLQCNTDAEIYRKRDSMTQEVSSHKHELLDNELKCAFCHSSKESEASGRMVHYLNGELLNANEITNSKVVHAHWNCVEWAPNVYFDGESAINLEAELSRSRRIKCSCCGNKGAALGCYEKSCRKSFHVPCAKSMPQCQWDTTNFVMLCPLHPDSKLPSQGSGYQKQKNKTTLRRPSCTKHIPASREISNNRSCNFRESSKKLVLSCSALATTERETVSEFQKLSGVTVLPKWDDSVTHIIASTDENGACKRTLKILMGILKGKWVLNIEWIKDCIRAMKLVEEERYEITVDVHGIRDGPRLGRLRATNNQPKIFAEIKFFFCGDFVPSYKGYLQELITAAGGTILLRKPVSRNHNTSPSKTSNCQVIIIYSVELPDKCNLNNEKNKILNQRRSDAELLAHSAAAKVATNSWLLNSIAGCTLQSLAG